MRGFCCSVISGTGAPAARFTRIATTGLGILGGISSLAYMHETPTINYLKSAIQPSLKEKVNIIKFFRLQGR